MITIEDYFMGRDKTHAKELSDTILKNAGMLVRKVNLLLTMAYKDKVQPTISLTTLSHIQSGWRPKDINLATPNASPRSNHISGNAVDISDSGARNLAKWCLKNKDKLESVGLWIERPQWTPEWVHFQQVSPRSGRRIFIPSALPPLCGAIQGENDEC